MKKNKKLFQETFGAQFIESVPTGPGVYTYLDKNGLVIYVGKAKNLRRRLSQYQNANRTRKNVKIKKILIEAKNLKFTAAATELDALILENQLIKDLKPKFNVDGAFSFMYPFIGVRIDQDKVALVYTNSSNIGLYQKCGYKFYGVFRSRFFTKNFFEAVTDLFGLLGFECIKQSKAERKKTSADRYTQIRVYRKMDLKILEQLPPFLKGTNSDFLQAITFELLERVAARYRAKQTEEYLKTIQVFFKNEAEPLCRAISLTSFLTYPVLQNERDALFIRARHFLQTADVGPFVSND